MNIREDIKQLKTGERDLRKFGFAVGGVFASLGLLFLLRHKVYSPYFLWPGIVLLAFGAVFPRALKFIYIVWMALAFVMGFAMAHVILTVFFFLVITPIGLVARLFDKDFLRLKLDKTAATYWIRCEQKVTAEADHERQF